MKFVDEVEIKLASGHGGQGCVSFRRESKVPRGGPDGGDGGRGGHVIFEVNDRLHSLLDLRYKKVYQARSGQQGSAQNMTGPDGEDLIISVPPGTVVTRKNGDVILDLTEGRHTFLKGGLGGKGNTFYKSSVNQAPNYAQGGLPGEETEVRLQLKLIADVGIIGFPNVGKSTLISKISAAKPKIADYPFTTLVPNLGVVKIEAEKSIVVADIPGLIPDAHKGTGLGIQFLKHIERTRCFIHVIDGNEMTARDPLEDYHQIQNELKAYDDMNSGSLGTNLMERTQVVVLNKVDSIDEERQAEIIEKFKQADVDILPISAVSGENMKKLLFKMGDLVFAREES